MNEGKEMQDPKICQQMEPLRILYACDELSEAERAAVEEHARQCPACAAGLAREIRLREAVRGTEQTADQLDRSDLLLARCRSELAEKLDDEGDREVRGGWLAALAAANRRRWLWQSFVYHPAMSAAVLVVVGVILGTVTPRLYREMILPSSIVPAMTVSAAPRLSDQELQTMGVAGINWLPDSSAGAPRVEVQLMAEKPMVLEGNPDDTDVKRVLTYVLQNGQRFDPGVRLDSLEVLRTRTSDGQVRRALCLAARNDRNPGVRLKALEALRGSEQDALVLQTLLEALRKDSNCGVRIEAINSLLAALRATGDKHPALEDPALVNVLRDRVKNDPNHYVRLQSAAAIRQLGPSQPY